MGNKSRNPVAKDLIEFSYETFGEEGKSVISYLLKHPYSKDDEISDATNLRERIIRKVLYDFSQEGAIELIRIKIGEGRNYEFKWAVKIDSFYKMMIKYYERELEKTEKALEDLTSTTFYSCGKTNHPVLTFDEAFEYEFQCPICGKIMKEISMRKKINILEKEKKKIERILQRLNKHYTKYVRQQYNMSKKK